MTQGMGSGVQPWKKWGTKPRTVPSRVDFFLSCSASKSLRFGRLGNMRCCVLIRVLPKKEKELETGVGLGQFNWVSVAAMAMLDGGLLFFLLLNVLV